MRRGVTLFSIVLVAAAFAAAVARADVVTTLTDTITGTTTTDTTTTSTTTTSTTTTTTTPTTTTQTTTTPTTTTTRTTTTTHKTTYATLGRSSLPQGCVGAGVAAIATPGTPVGMLALPGSGLGASEYPAWNPFIRLSSAWAGGTSCSTRHVTLRNLSLFGGAVTATTVSATNGTGTVTGLRLNGSSISLAPGQTIAVGSWGLLTRAAKGGRLIAPLALRLVQTHGSVPAGTTIYIAFAARAAQQQVTQPAGHHHHRHHSSAPAVPQPLAATPPLGLPTSDYVFPIDGGASYVDTYGAGRSDIYDGWHHGDDLFAPLGTPVVAVADGKLSLVGWNAIGGWRLWLTDSKGNSFYYAHLAGYSRYILTHRHVKAGQVIAFLGRTGDAFPTPPHVHFEVHPHQFVQLGYDGAVNPTSYLKSWRVETLPQSQIPAAASLQAPAGTPSQEAAVVWGELLKARHLMPDGQPLVAVVSGVRRPFPAEPAAAQFVDARRLASSHRATTANPWPLVTLGLTLAALAAVGSLAVLRRRRSS